MLLSDLRLFNHTYRQGVCFILATCYKSCFRFFDEIVRSVAKKVCVSVTFSRLEQSLRQNEFIIYVHEGKKGN